MSSSFYASCNYFTIRIVPGSINDATAAKTILLNFMNQSKLFFRFIRIKRLNVLLSSAKKVESI
jgi:hypothetical protein